ncbi:hypothetical protein LCGC14_1833040 [marine sediment metagenome]|uniref:Ribosomal protein S27a domain-containing protein n=1 Tax=marine sediment metagenome TaxID=412755 RepID=A0A0F9GFP4_9ZZZZ
MKKIKVYCGNCGKGRNIKKRQTIAKCRKCGNYVNLKSV